MNIINWNEYGANLKVLEGIEPVLEEDEKEKLFLRMLGLNTGDSKMYGMFGWMGYFRQTKLHNSDVKKVYYVELNANNHSLKNVNTSSRWYYGGSIQVAIGFAPKFDGVVPDNLSEIRQEDYPVAFRSNSTCRMTQDNMFIMSLAVKEAASLLYQVHQKYKV